jgi:hypothetical protein
MLSLWNIKYRRTLTTGRAIASPASSLKNAIASINRAFNRLCHVAQAFFRFLVFPGCASDSGAGV